METYPVTPHEISTVKISRKTNVTEFENGVEQRAKVWEDSKKTFKLEHKMLTQANAKIISDFFDAMGGQFEPFFFYNYKDQQTYRVRFASDDLNLDSRKVYQNITIEVVTC